MDIYHGWCNLRHGVGDKVFADAFNLVAGRAEPVEGVHHGVNALVQNVTFALYRDFPDPVRQYGEERF